jgi:hypothetical protein
MSVQGRKDTLTPELRLDIDTLDPPQDAVSPVTPFESEHELADNLVPDYSHAISAFAGVSKYSADARMDQVAVQ